MSESAKDAPRSADEGREKQPYAPPAIAWEQSFRSRADLMAACGKAEAGVFDCDTNGIAS
jgi:hypothetical protein